MSRNSKNAKRMVEARQRKGVTGSAKTQPKHGKLRAWWQTTKPKNYSAWFHKKKQQGIEVA